MAVSLNPGQQYGDAKSLRKLAAGMHRTGGTFGPMVQNGQAGRPVGSTQKAPTQNAQQSPQQPPVQQPPQVPEGVDPAHMQIMDDAAQKMAQAQTWQAIAQNPDAGPWASFYAIVAAQQARQALARVKTQTPNS